ncbi:MAG TPA: SIR2 family protein [Pyrinomonadaceae bacterium]|nr:SIR2 family protein [Pyrinomonadaceae bacterium]
MNTQDLSALRARRRDKNLIPFVGAGMSMPLGLPSWTKLIDFIADELDYDPEVFRLSGDNRQLAEYYVEVKGGIGPLRSELDRLFDPADEDIKASKAHEALVKLELPLIYTTNYDRIIERAFELHGSECHEVGNIDDLKNAPQGITQIVKFHGTFSDDASLVLTESSYFDRLEFESALDIKLRADMLGKCLLFIGYSLSDINVRYMLYKLSKLRQQVRRGASRLPNAYMVTYDANEVQRTLLARWDVSVIELDPLDKAGSTAEFLGSLR